MPSRIWRQRLSPRASTAARPRLATSVDPLRRSLRLEPLEDRRLLSITVNTLADEADGSIVDGDISLRDAIASATPGETINFSVTGAINLTNLGQLVIDKYLTIRGPGASLLTINAFDPTPTVKNGDGSRVFYIDDGNGASDKYVIIIGLALIGGDVTGDGGAILLRESLLVAESTISGNSASGDGGGISNLAGSMTIASSTISGNTAAFGGGIATSGSNDLPFQPAHTGIRSSTISGNTATGSGGGVWSSISFTYIHHSTITNNQAAANSGGGVAGQRHYLIPTNVQVQSSIIAGNTANDDVHQSSVASGNLFASSGYNLVGTGNAVGQFNQPGDRTGVANPMLGPLTDNGGPTMTHALLVGSPAVNAVPPAVAGPFVPYDQRGSGFPRLVHGFVDIGAYEADFAVGANLVVDTLSELDGNIGPGHLALREALWLANLEPDPQTITFDLSVTSGGPATLLLTFGELSITHDVTIMGPGAGLLTIDASGNDPTPGANNGDGSRVFKIDDGLAPSNGGGVTSINFGYRPGFDGILGTSDDVPYASAEVGGFGEIPRLIDNEYASVGVHFVGDNAPTLGLVGGGFNSDDVFGSGTNTLLEGFPTNSGGVAPFSVVFDVTQTSVSVDVIAFLNSSGTSVPLTYRNDGVIVATQTLTDLSHPSQISSQFTLNPGLPFDQVDFGLSGPNNGGIAIDNLTYVAPPLGSRAFADVEITGLTFTGGDVSGLGGAIRSLENLTVISTISGNAATASGGGIYSLAADLVVTGSTISGNSASMHGGGILNSGGSLTVTGSTITGNETLAGGGGIANFNGGLQVTASTISGNSSLGSGFGGGGGIYSMFGSINIIDSTLGGNTSQHQGGGIFHLSGPLTIVNSTLSGNTANDQGGGMYSRFGQLAVRHSTITGNQARGMNSDPVRPGGGVMRSGSSAYSTNLEHTIVAGNSGQFSGDDLRGSFTARYSLIGIQTGDPFIVDNGGNLIGDLGSPINPQLGPLGDNGGATLTHALLSGSPAIDRGDSAAMVGFGGVPPYDQRGFAFNRVVNGRIDMGAFERGAVSANFDIDLDVDGFDFLAWQRGFGLTVGATKAQGNADGDGDVDGADLAVWKVQFGNPALVAAAAPAASAALVADDSPSRLSPQAVDAAMAWQMASEAPASRPLFRPRWLRAR